MRPSSVERERMFKAYRLEDNREKARIEQALREKYFSGYDPVFLDSPAGKADVAAHVDGRYNTCVDSLLPWLARFATLDSMEVVEVGCGTGSSTAAFARVVRHISGYDIHAASVEGARARMQVMGLRNAEVHLVDPTQLIDALRKNHPTGTDIFLLYAVLEHQTIEERLQTLKLGWEMLKPGGLLVVCETPNRLCFMDDHTSFMSFFHSLPPELAALYAQHSPRQVFRDSIARLSPTDARQAVIRWGQGVSHHEFELALGELEPLLVGSGFEPEVLGMFPPMLDEELLRLYVQRNEQSVPLAFTRRVLNLVFRKGDNSALRAHRVPPPPFRILPELLTSFPELMPSVPVRAPSTPTPEPVQSSPSAPPEVPLRYQIADQLNDAVKHMGVFHRQARRLVKRALELGRRAKSH